MILYNVTVNIDDSVHEGWLEWMKSKHIPDVLATGLFIENKIFKVKSDDEGNTYSIQYFLEDIDKLNEYQSHHAPALQADHMEKYKGKFVAFRTIMELLD